MKRIYILFILLNFFPLALWPLPPKVTPQLQDTLKREKIVTTLISTLSDGLGEVKRTVEKLDGYDTLYIEPNRYNYSAMLQNTNYWQHYLLRASNEQGTEQSINIAPRSSIKVGPYFGWRWIFLGYTFDVSRMGKATANTEFNLSIYTAKVGGDLIYIRNKENFKIGEIDGFDGYSKTAFKGADFNGMKSYTTMLNVYYVFNNRKFSYPAAYAQSTIQRISAGSFILGLRYDHHKVHFDHTKLPSALPVIDEMKIGRVNYYNAGISLGYAYNWVIARNLLFNISIMPALGYKKTKGEPWNKDVLLNDVKTLNVDFTSRAALVWNNSRMFMGASFVNYVYGYNRAYFNLKNSISYLNFYLGFNFSRRERDK